MTTYKIDPMHSEIKFKVKHLMISNVTGAFKSFDATMEADKEDFSDAKISFEADVDSIDTNQEQRDVHLKSDDFFNAEKFPKIKFISKGIKKVSDDEFKLTGDLTIRDVTKELTMDVDFGGTTVDFYGQKKAGFELTGKINRSDFNLKWNAVTEAGGIVVSNEIKLQLEAQMVKQ
jgi:polyisoprenoid-binding protein YceI